MFLVYVFVSFSFDSRGYVLVLSKYVKSQEQI